MTFSETPSQPRPTAEALRALISGGPTPEVAGRLLQGGAASRLLVERVHFPGARPVQVQIRAWDQTGASRILIGEWVGEDAADQAEAETERLRKSRRGRALPALLVAADPAHGLILRPAGFDARLPGLRLLHDRRWASARLVALGCHRRASVSLVAHRLGKRAVLRIAGRDGIRYARLRPVTSGAGRRAYDLHLDLWAALQGESDLSIPRPLGFDAELGLALFDSLPGALPAFHGLDGFRASRAVMRALAVLQALPITPPPHHAADELAVLDEWHGRMTEVFPDLARAMQQPLSRLRDAMAAAAPIPPVPCHRDLHDGQILLDRGRAGLLDFDTLRRSDPALDLGNLQAHLLLAGLRDGQPRGAFVTAMENAVPRLSPARIALWRRAAALRLAMIYSFSGEPREVVHGLIRAAM